LRREGGRGPQRGRDPWIAKTGPTLSLPSDIDPPPHKHIWFFSIDRRTHIQRWQKREKRVRNSIPVFAAEGGQEGRFIAHLWVEKMLGGMRPQQDFGYGWRPQFKAVLVCMVLLHAAHASEDGGSLQEVSRLIACAGGHACRAHPAGWPDVAG